MNTNIQNIACLSELMPACNKLHLSQIWGSQFIKKSSNFEAGLKIAYK